MQTRPDFSPAALRAVVPTLLFGLCGAVDLPGSLQSKRGGAWLCSGPPAACWLIPIWCGDWDTPAKGMLIWTGKRCVNVGVGNIHPGLTSSLRYGG